MSMSNFIFHEWKEKGWNGQDIEIAKEWYEAGWKQPEDALKWYEYGWKDPVSAFKWYNAGWQWDNLIPIALSWHEAGWDDPDRAEDWFSSGWKNPVEAKKWHDAGWNDEWVSSEKAKIYYDTQLYKTPEEAYRQYKIDKQRGIDPLTQLRDAYYNKNNNTVQDFDTPADLATQVFEKIQRGEMDVTELYRSGVINR